jgi:hypothetical protein
LQGLWVAVPLNRYFLGMDLALTPQQLGGLTYALPILVAFTSWIQSKMTTTPGGTDGQAASMNQSMTLMMPLMFGWFSLSFATGLSFYFVVSNVIGIITQGFISGWEGLLFWKGFSLSKLLPIGGSSGRGSAQATGTQQIETKPTATQKGMTSGSSNRKKKRRRKR